VLPWAAATIWSSPPENRSAPATGRHDQTILALRAEHWKFAEENESGWVDVYRILTHNRLIWAKLKIEMRTARELVIIISFHEYDDDVPV
jgi:hypothetical protein